MGKPEDELSLPTAVDVADTSTTNVRRDCRVNRLFRLRCLVVLLLGIAVFLSVVFWLPPLFKHPDADDSDLDPRYRGHDIVASFKLEKPISVLEDNIAQLEADILDEIEVPSTKVVVLSLEDSFGSNVTDVIFGVDSESKYSSLSSTTQSLIQASFESLVIRQSSLQLTTSLFGEPYFFEMLKFPGGITVTPHQKAFPLQKCQISFNFTLNFCIYQILENFEELRSQLKSGLHLAPYENLYISLTNSRGSTVAPPATVQTSVLLAVGITPSKPRLKQLAQTLKDSHGKNLGLNHTVFGKVKQVILSSILQHSLGESPAPASAPITHSHHHQYHHHHHEHDHGGNVAPAKAPSPLSVKSPPLSVKGPAPKISATPPVKSGARPPGCRFGLKGQQRGKTPEASSVAPAAAPKISPHFSIPPPHPQGNSPPPAVHQIPPSSPLPHVVLAHVHPPSVSEADPEPPDRSQPFAPSPSPSAGGNIPNVPRVILMFVVLLLHP